MTDILKDIDNFHKKYGFEKNEKIDIPDNSELINFRTAFLMEELAEYTNAITKKDAAGALDALVDIVYIALGTAWLFNLPFEKAWNEVQKANMSKIRAKDKTGKRGTKFDVIKPKDWKAPNIEKIIDEVLVANAKSVEEFRAGKEKAFNALIGQAMKASKGKANPAQLTELLKKKLG